MTITTDFTATDTFRLVAADLYKDIHKGIRSELFAVTTAAGRVDPGDAIARADVASYVRDVVWLLETHAEHEDASLQPAVEVHVPDVAERIAADHIAFDIRTQNLVALAQEAAAASVAAEQRRLGHLLYLDLAGFTSDYLAHQAIEERVIMPALEDAIGVDAVLAIHGAIVSSIPPADMARSLAVMLPAMNLDDRTEMLGGMRASAPAEVFAGVWGLAGSVLEPRDLAAVATRLGL